VSAALAVTGHRSLPDDTGPLEHGIEGIFEARKFEVVWSMLAEGADRLVADIALRHGVGIAAVLPFDDYELDFKGHSRQYFDNQLKHCVEVIRLSRPRSRNGYLDAGKEIVDRAAVVIAVWDGTRVEGRGGTAQVVNYANERGLEVIRVDPTAGWVQATGPRHTGER
jgi:hypothetical protein